MAPACHASSATYPGINWTTLLPDIARPAARKERSRDEYVHDAHLYGERIDERVGYDERVQEALMITGHSVLCIVA